MGLNQTLNRFIASRANRISVKPYDHAITRYTENTPNEDYTNTNPQLTMKFFIEFEYIFHLDSTNKNFDKLIARALTNSNAYESFSTNFYHFALTFHFFTPKERDLYCSHEIMLRSKLAHTYTYYKVIQKHYITNPAARNPQHRFMFTDSKYYHFFF